jgi:hypothetical protein
MSENSRAQTDEEFIRWFVSEFKPSAEKLKLKSTYDIYKKSFKNFDAVKQSTKCGCFNCEKIFDASEVVDFVTEEDGQKTALCPYCCIDSVIQDANTDLTPELLSKMHAEWFI